MARAMGGAAESARAARRPIRRILATTGPAGEPDMLERLVAQAREASADALVVLGGLGPDEPKAEGYRRLFKALARAHLPTFYLPGPGDAPLRDYLQAAYNIEVVYPLMRGVHGGFAVGAGHVVFAGMGGEIVDDPETARDEVVRLRYPAWEVEYRFKVLAELKDYEKVFLFTTSPAHKGLHEAGSAVLAEMIKSYKPRLVLLSGPPRHERLGTSLVVAAGRLSEGEWSLVNAQEARVDTGRLR